MRHGQRGEEGIDGDAADGVHVHEQGQVRKPVDAARKDEEGHGGHDRREQRLVLEHEQAGKAEGQLHAVDVEPATWHGDVAW